MRDRRGMAHAIVLGAWAALFTWLWLSGEMVRYLGPRTRWVVAFGAIALAVVTVGSLFALRGAGRRSLSGREGAGLALLLLPIAVLVAMPDAELGSQAVSRRDARGGLLAAVERTAPHDIGTVSFREIRFATESTEYRRATGITDGLEVSLTGFVSQAAGERFDLARFYISCCAADAIPYSVSVDASGVSDVAPSNDQWLDVRGVLQDRDGTLTLVAQRVTEISAPKDPYLF